MKVKPSVNKICDKCKVIRGHGRVMVICDSARHKQRQGCPAPTPPHWLQVLETDTTKRAAPRRPETDGGSPPVPGRGHPPRAGWGSGEHDLVTRRRTARWHASSASTSRAISASRSP